jgi:colicin import membrane protein
MARSGITYNEVITAIDSIIMNGEEPTIQRIRECLGTGSPNTIHKYLVAWRGSRPVEARQAPGLPAELQAALVKEIDRQSAEARSWVEKSLIEIQKEAATLAKAGEELEEINIALQEQNQKLMAEREQQTALANVHQREIESLKADLDIERKSAEQARIVVALNQNKIETLEKEGNLINTKLAEAINDKINALAAQVVAEKSLAVAESQLENEKATVADLRQRLTESQAEIKEKSRLLLEAQKEVYRVAKERSIDKKTNNQVDSL